MMAGDALLIGSFCIAVEMGMPRIARLVRYLGWAFAACVCLILLVLVISWQVARNSKSIGDLFVERSTPNITASACLKNSRLCKLTDDAPIGAMAEYRRCGGAVAGTRIKGEPLACSEQFITDLLLSDWSTPGQSAYRQLRRGCRKHDLC